jgi:tetratricopeptide (TPR) repeat protein
MKRSLLLIAILNLLIGSTSAQAAADKNYFKQGAHFYADGRKSEAMEAFEEAIRHKDRQDEARAFIDRIRKETVESIRNKALTGVSKSNWQTKYYYMNVLDNKVSVGVSIQELFERDSLYFRPGAIDALNQLALAVAKADNKEVRVEIVNEVNQDVAPDKSILAQQEVAVFSYLSLAARGQLPKF